MKSLTESRLRKLRTTMLTLLAGAAVLGLLAYLGWPQRYAQVSLRLWLPLWCATSFAYGFASPSARWPWMRKWTRYARHSMLENGGGFYAAMAASAFVVLELQRFYLGAVDLWSHRDDLPGHLLANLFNFSVDSIMNGIYAVAWPGFLKNIVGFSDAWPYIPPAYALY